MNTPTPQAPQFDTDVLQARLSAIELQLAAHESKRVADAAVAEANYLQIKSHFTKQKDATQNQIDAASKAK